MSWEDAVYDAILELVDENDSLIFTRSEFIISKLDSVVAETNSYARHPSQSLSRILQILRNKNLIIFKDRGVYELVEQDSSDEEQESSSSSEEEIEFEDESDFENEFDFDQGGDYFEDEEFHPPPPPPPPPPPHLLHRLRWMKRKRVKTNCRDLMDFVRKYHKIR